MPQHQATDKHIDDECNEDDMEQYVGDQAYQMFEELLALVRNDTKPAEEEAGEEAALDQDRAPEEEGKSEGLSIAERMSTGQSSNY